MPLCLKSPPSPSNYINQLHENPFQKNSNEPNRTKRNLSLSLSLSGFLYFKLASSVVSHLTTPTFSLKHERAQKQNAINIRGAHQREMITPRSARRAKEICCCSRVACLHLLANVTKPNAGKTRGFVVAAVGAVKRGAKLYFQQALPFKKC